MTIQEMHYDVKTKLNKKDSQQNRNLKIPEIDWALNEAMELFIKAVALPRFGSKLGLEIIQRNIEEIRPLVREDVIVPITNLIAALPSDYWHFLDATVEVEKGCCGVKDATVMIQKHGEDFQNSPFNTSSYEWGEINAVFNDQGLNFFTGGDFEAISLKLSYIRKPEYFHNAANFRGGSYTLPSGVVLTGTVDCPLPEATHREIVDIAVLNITGELNLPDYQVKYNKINFHNLK